jgi:hypothetical protein
VTADVEIIGVRHHSPACARLVAARLRALRPRWVLIEGPSDFNDRIAELQDPAHAAPIAIFSYFGDAAHTEHTFSPFAEHSPEWVALQVAAEIGAAVRFIDLPYWHREARGRAPTYADALAGRREHERARALAIRFGIDGSDALWDHLFEQEMPTEVLSERLCVYFDALRDDEPGDASDRAREAYMADWLQAIAARGEPMVALCGGWHRRPLLRALQTRQAVDEAALRLTPPETITRHGSFLIPYSERRLEAFGGYGAGVQSPAYYRWLYHHGAEAAAAQAVQAVVSRLRAAKQQVSTAALIAASTRTALLARLRGHAQPTRVDVLDGLLDALGGEALTAPPPWNARGTLTMRDDPMLREVLLALTGDRVGRLAPDTPLPPLVFDVQALIETHALGGAGSLSLDRRDARDSARAETLWRLSILAIPGFEHLGNSAPQAARQLGADQHFLEHWQLTPGDGRHAALIAAGAWGPTLHAAALRRLDERVAEAAGVAMLADLYATAVRARYAALGDTLLSDLDAALALASNHGEVARAGLRLLALTASTLGPGDPSRLLAPVLTALLARLLWLLEGLHGPEQPADGDDVAPFEFIGRLLDAGPLAIDTGAVLPALARFADAAALPPAARGAGFALLWRHAGDAGTEAALLAAVRGCSDGERLGDFLFGLFALARNECLRSPSLIGVLDAVVGAMSDHDFLVAAPALRQAFHYFPPRERAAIGVLVGRLHGTAVTPDWLRMPTSIDDVRRGVRLRGEVDALRRRFAL